MIKMRFKNKNKHKKVYKSRHHTMKSYKTKAHMRTMSHGRKDNILHSNIKNVQHIGKDSVAIGMSKGTRVRSTDISRDSNVPTIVPPPNNNGMISFHHAKSYNVSDEHSLRTEENRSLKSSILAKNKM